MTGLLLFAVALFVVGLWWVRRTGDKALEAAHRRQAAAPRPDYRVLGPVLHECSACSMPFERSPVVVEPCCDACVRRRFEASVVADKVEWMAKGWPEKG